MLLDFNHMKEISVEGMNGGNGTVFAKMYMNQSGKIIVSRIAPHSSIGEHIQATSDDINYVLSGVGKAFCDGIEEELHAGVCHYCPIINTGDEDLILFSVVSEK